MTIQVSHEQLRKAKLGVGFVTFVTFIFVVVFTVQVVKGVGGPIASLHWVSNQATLINVAIDEMTTTTTRDNRNQYTLYTPRILYKYTIQGQEYTGTKVSWYDIYDDGFMLELANRLKRTMADANTIEIYVNPNNPTESIVIKSIIWEKMLPVFLGFFLCWPVFIWLLYVLIFRMKFV